MTGNAKAGISGQWPLRLVQKVIRRLVVAVMGQPATPLLLEMMWPVTAVVPESKSLAGGYVLRQYSNADRVGYQALLAEAGMPECPLSYWEKHHLPNGFFVVEHTGTGSIVAACFASHHPTERHPQAGNFGWLAVHPAHGGQGLGRIVSAAVTNRLLRAGYEHIYLETHDFRIPAIQIYLSMGWVPLLYAPDMKQRWAAVYAQLGRSPLSDNLDILNDLS